MNISSIPQLQRSLEQAFKKLEAYCQSVPDEVFFRQPESKWSVAQQVKHLESATRMAGLAFRLPRFIVRIVGGKPNRPSRSYDELVERYRKKLSAGGRASGPYIPKPVAASRGKQKLLDQLGTAMHRMGLALNRHTEASLDNYLAPHPLLGKITLRELVYFTIYHCYHHLAGIEAANRP